MPGVVISTSVRTGPSTATVRESSQLFVVGKAERGPAGEPILVESLADFESVFGGYQSDSFLHPTIETFFEEGGTRAFVGRVVGASATVGELTLEDDANADVLTLTANGAGAWSANVDVEVETVGDPEDGKFKVNLYYNDVRVYSTGTVSSTSQAVGRINLSAIATQYVTASVDNAALTPQAILPTPLSAGNSRHENIAGASSYVAALNVFDDSLGSGVVVCPELASETLDQALIEHANAYSRIAFLFAEEDATLSDVKAAALDIQGNEHAEHAAIYYPWVEVPTSVPGISRLIPPVGYVAGKRAIAHNQTGPHLPAAGLLSAARFVTGTKVAVDKVAGDDLDDNFVNAIRLIQNTIRIYGARSCSADVDNFRYITQQDIVNTIVTEGYRAIEDIVFSSIDGRNTIFADVESRLIAVLTVMRNIGALYPAFDTNGRQIDDGYTVRCDSTLNPTSQLAEGLVRAKVGVRVSSIGDKIQIDIVKSNLTSSVV